MNRSLALLCLIGFDRSRVIILSLARYRMSLYYSIWSYYIPRLEVCRVAHRWAGCAPCQFCWDQSDWSVDRSDRWIRSAPMHTGLTGGVHRSDRWCNGWTSGVRIDVGSLFSNFRPSIVKFCKLISCIWAQFVKFIVSLSLSIIFKYCVVLVPSVPSFARDYRCCFDRAVGWERIAKLSR